MARSVTSELAVVLVKVSVEPLAAPELKSLNVPDHVPLLTVFPLVAPELKFANAAIASACVIVPVAVSVSQPIVKVSPSDMLAALKVTVDDSVTLADPFVVDVVGATMVPAAVVVEPAKVEVADSNPAL